MINTVRKARLNTVTNRIQAGFDSVQKGFRSVFCRIYRPILLSVSSIQSKIRQFAYSFSPS